MQHCNTTNKAGSLWSFLDPSLILVTSRKAKWINEIKRKRQRRKDYTVNKSWKPRPGSTNKNNAPVAPKIASKMFAPKKMAFVQNPFSLEFGLKQRQSALLRRRIGKQTQPSGTPMKVPTVASPLASRMGLVRYLPYRYFSIALKVFFFSLSDGHKIFASNWLWIKIWENVVLSKIDFTMTTINKRLWNW